MINYGHQWIDEDDVRSVVEVLRSDWITQGPAVEKFEKSVAEYTNTKYAVAFNSGTSALHAAMSVAGVKSGNEVITSPITFVATSNSVLFCNGTPVFGDIDPDTYCIDINKLKSLVTDKTKVIAPVDFAGYPVDIRAIRDEISNEDIVIVEDAAHALGSINNGCFSGSESDMAIFSFHPVKHITTGEGGMVVTNNEEYAEKLRLFRSHGITKDPSRLCRTDVGPWYYEMQSLGYNNRITDIQCALGLAQLDKIEKFIDRRNRIADMYDRAFSNHPNLVTPSRPVKNSRHAFHIYPLVLNNVPRKELFMGLRDKGIFCQVHYIPVHLQPYYVDKFGYNEGMFPVAEQFYDREITIPLYPGMSDDDVNFVIQSIMSSVDEIKSNV